MMKMSEQQIRLMIKESIQNNLSEGRNWGNVSAIKDFEYLHCDLSKIDPRFLKVLNLFKSKRQSEKANWDDKGFIRSLADALGEGPDFINQSMINAFNDLFLPGIEMLGLMPIGGVAICKLMTKLSILFSEQLQIAYRDYDDGSLAYQNTKASQVIPDEDKQYFLNGIIKDDEIKNAEYPSSSTKLFKYSVEGLKRETGDNNINGLDTILFSMFIPDTVKSGSIDTTEITQYQDFVDQWANNLRNGSGQNSHRAVIESFYYFFERNISKNDSEYTSGTYNAKTLRSQIVCEYLIDHLDDVEKLFPTPLDFAKFLLEKGLKRINQFTRI